MVENATAASNALYDQDEAFVYYVPPDTRTKWQKFKDSIYNPDSHTFLGRTAKSWGGILIFYVIFYSGLAALFAICLQGLLYSINLKHPKWQLDSSLIGTNPGLGFRPISKNVEKDGSLIWYQASNETNYRYWTDGLNDFLEPYFNNSYLPGGGKNQQFCDFDNPPAEGKVCAVNIESWGPCTPDNGYGYNSSSPCVFIKLNRIYGWQPDYYNSTEELPEAMPEELKAKIATSDPEKLNMIWVSCVGENPADKEHVGPISYFPTQGFPGYYYPYINVEGYLSPVVAVRFERPKLNVLINVECRAWAKNIHYVNANQQREGSVHFELMID